MWCSFLLINCFVFDQLMDNLLGHLETLGAAAQQENVIEAAVEGSSTEEEEETEEAPAEGDIGLQTPPSKLTLEYLSESIHKVRETAKSKCSLLVGVRV